MMMMKSRVFEISRQGLEKRSRCFPRKIMASTVSTTTIGTRQFASQSPYPVKTFNNYVFKSGIIQQTHNRLSTAAASGGGASSKKGGSSESSSYGNFFLDHLGKIFLAAIAGVIATLVRGSYNTSNRNRVRDWIEDNAAVDPVEIEDLRIANSELTPEVFRTIVQNLVQDFPRKSASYTDFTKSVRRTMVHLKGDAFTVELGHLIDRVVVAVLKENNKSAEDEMPLELWLTTLSLAMNSPVTDRIHALYDILKEEETGVVEFHKVRSLVGHLLETCQLAPDAQVIATEEKYPTQQFRRGGPKDLVPWEGSDKDPIDYDAFAAILRSKSVCAWGECYHKKTFGPGE
jgi:hypothetical protein